MRAMSFCKAGNDGTKVRLGQPVRQSSLKNAFTIPANSCHHNDGSVATRMRATQKSAQRNARAFLCVPV
jgi:hypothetical protein